MASSSWIIPPGVIVPYGGPANENVPANWAYCNGKMVQSTDPTYSSLYAVIGTAFGGDGNPNFYLPDLRGYFIRGVDDGALRDPDSDSRTPPQPSGSGGSGNSGDRVGSVQGYATQSLIAQVGVQYSAAPSGSGNDASFGYSMNNILGGQLQNSENPSYIQWATHDLPIVPSGSETRPLNSYVYYLICLGVPMPSGMGS